MNRKSGFAAALLAGALLLGTSVIQYYNNDTDQYLCQKSLDSEQTLLHTNII